MWTGHTCIYVGMMLNSALMGSVISRIGFKYGFFLTGLVSLLLIGCFSVLVKGFSVST